MPSLTLWSAFLTRDASGCSYQSSTFNFIYYLEGWMNHNSGYQRIFPLAPLVFPLLGKWVAAFPPQAPLSTDYLRQGQVDEGFTFFSHLKRKKDPPGNQHCFHTFRHCSVLLISIPIFTMENTDSQKKKNHWKKWVLIVPNRIWKMVRNYSLLYWPFLIHQRWEYHRNSHHNILQYLQFL